MQLRNGPEKHKRMSQYEEVIQIVEAIANMSETSSYELLRYAERLSQFSGHFSAIVNGTNDSSAKMVYSSFISAQKELYKAAKVLLEAAKSGYDWCGDTSPKLVLKKVMR